jgi:hypothetical protein
MDGFAIQVMASPVGLDAAVAAPLTTSGLPIDMTLDFGTPFASLGWIVVAVVVVFGGAVIRSSLAPLAVRVLRALRPVPIHTAAKLDAGERVTDAA